MNPTIRHMTHIHNLLLILQQDGIWCDRQAGERGLTQQDIGHVKLKTSRSRKPVKVGPGGFLCDYVPFYFAYRTPMLSAIHNRTVAGYSGGQEEVIYLVTKTDDIQQAGLPFVFTNGHAAVEISRQFTELDDLTEIDWEMIREKYWTDTDDDNDRKRRKQAEFLVHEFLPWPLIRGIAVQTQPMADQVSVLLQGQAHPPPVRVMPAWYF